MSLVRMLFIFGSALTLSVFAPTSPAQSFKPVGGLDCNGYSKIQKPLRPLEVCADFHSEYGTRTARRTFIGSLARTAVAREAIHACRNRNNGGNDVNASLSSTEQNSLESVI